MVNNTIRVMWFYQNPANKYNIYFDAMRAGIRRAERLKLRYVDLGPSNNEKMAELKAQFSFEEDPDWKEKLLEGTTDNKLGLLTEIIPSYSTLELRNREF